MKEKLELMLSVYREKLEKAQIPPIDYVACIRLEAQINLLENLWFYARQQPRKGIAAGSDFSEMMSQQIRKTAPDAEKAGNE